MAATSPSLEEQLGEAAELDGLDEDLTSLSLAGPIPDVVIDVNAPLRLGAAERQLLHLLNGALRTSDYTDKVDHVNPGYRSYSFGSRSYGFGGGSMNRGKAARIKENVGLFDFALAPEQMETMNKLNVGKRLTWKGVDPDSEK